MFGKKNIKTDLIDELSPNNFEAVFNTYKSMVLGVALRYVRCQDDANDVLQETFISLFNNYKMYDPEKPLRPWIQKITINMALTYIRKNYRFKLFEDDSAICKNVMQENSDEENFEFSKEKLLQLLQQLPDGYRTVFNLYAIDGLSHKEIAEYLEITETTSRTQLLKARKFLKNILETKKIFLHERA